MSRIWLTVLTTLAFGVASPVSAQARTPCPGESAIPTEQNHALVSDAIICLTNQLRVHYGLPQLRGDARLQSSARGHSRDMATQSFFGHTGPGGSTPTTRALAAGYPFGVGENIAYGQINARAVVIAWMQSTGHCRNILSAARDLGVGTAVSGLPYYAQDLGDYFSQTIDETARNACPHSPDLDALVAVDQPSATIITALPGPPAPTPVSTPSDPPPAPTAVPLTTKPSRPKLQALKIAKRVRVRGRRRGTTIRYKLSTKATLVLRIQRAAGRKGYKTLPGSIVRRGKRGTNKLRFSGRLRGRTLRPGRYRLRAYARAPSGRTSRKVHTRFVAVRR